MPRTGLVMCLYGPGLLQGASLPSGHILSHQAGLSDGKGASAHKDLLK